jgi:hypothetical protein
VKTITIIVMSDYKLDPRVYKHAIIAKKNGYNINVISVTTPMHDHYEEIDGVHVYYHSLISPIGIKLLDVFKNICKSSILNKCKLNQTSIHIIKNTKINDVIKYMFVYVFSNIVLFFKIRKIKTDLYLVNDLPVIFTGFLLSKVNKKPVIYDSHELWVEFDEHFSNIFKNLLLWHERTFIRRVSCVVTVNHQIAAILMERYNIKPPLVVFNCPMYSEPLDNNMRFNNNIIYQGRYCENRGLEEILESSKNIHCNLYMRGFDYWETNNSLLLSYGNTFFPVLGHDNISNLVQGVENPTVIDFLAPTDTIAELFRGLPPTDKLGIAIAKDTPELTKAVNNALKALKDEGTYDTIYKKWFGEKKSK